MGFKKFKRLRKGVRASALGGNTLYPQKDNNLSLSAAPSLVSRTDLRIKSCELWQKEGKGLSRIYNYLFAQFTSRVQSKMRAASGGFVVINGHGRRSARTGGLGKVRQFTSQFPSSFGLTR